MSSAMLRLYNGRQKSVRAYRLTSLPQQEKRQDNKHNDKQNEQTYCKTHL